MLSPSDMVAVETKHGTRKHWNPKCKLREVLKHILCTRIYTQYYPGVFCLKQIILNIFKERTFMPKWMKIPRPRKQRTGYFTQARQDQCVLGKEIKRSIRKFRTSPVGHCHLAEGQAEVQALSSEAWTHGSTSLLPPRAPEAKNQTTGSRFKKKSCLGF